MLQIRIRADCDVRHIAGDPASRCGGLKTVSETGRCWKAGDRRVLF